MVQAVPSIGSPNVLVRIGISEMKRAICGLAGRVPTRDTSRADRLIGGARWNSWAGFASASP